MIINKICIIKLTNRLKGSIIEKAYKTSYETKPFNNCMQLKLTEIKRPTPKVSKPVL